MTETMFRELHATVIRVQNFDKMVQWYEEVLALQLVKLEKEISLAVFDLPGPSYLCIHGMPTAEYEPQEHPKCLTNWRVDDIEEVRTKLLKQGVNCRPIMGGGGFKVFRFFDPEGTIHDCCWYDERYLPEK